jgi:hypothetical protein
MTDAMMKVLITQNLRKEPRRLSDFVQSADGGVLQVQASETAKTGAKPSQDEVVGNRTITWVFVEATAGASVDLRKGFVSDGALGSTDAVVAAPEAPVAFDEEVEKETFANACYLQAMSRRTNPAYLYALAFALSGDKWSDTLVKSSDPAGVFRFPKDTWAALLAEPEADGLQADQIKFPNAQCVVAAIIAAKSANLLQGVITDRPLSAVDLFLAHLFADDGSCGSNSAAVILQSTDTNQPSKGVVGEDIYLSG